jgi:hypothetical protein
MMIDASEFFSFSLLTPSIPDIPGNPMSINTTSESAKDLCANASSQFPNAPMTLTSGAD